MTSAPPNNNLAGPHMYGAGANPSMLVSYLAEEHGISPSSPLPYFGVDSPNSGAVSSTEDVVTILNLNNIDPAFLSEGDVLEILFPVHADEGLDPEVFRSIETASYNPSSALHGDGNVDLMLLPSDEASLLDDEFVLPKAYSCDYDDGLMAESSVDTIVLETFPPRAPGGYLEPNCHFTVRAMPDLLLQSVMGVLQDKQVDCELNADVFKMKCEAYRNCSRVEFVVRLFTTGDEATAETPLLAVEFQRRFGEPSYFHELYHLTRDTLSSVFKDESHDDGASAATASTSTSTSASPSLSSACANSATAAALSAGRSLMQAPPLDLPDVQACIESRRSTLSSLIQMCSSECVDVKVAGISMLADLSSQCAMRELMLNNGCVDIFLSCLCSTIADVHRCAITGLANLISCATNKTLCQRMLQCPIARSNLCGLISSDCPQVVRESARAVSFLTSTLPDAALANHEIQQCIRTLALSEDEEARQRAHRILEAASTSTHS